MRLQRATGAEEVISNALGITLISFSLSAECHKASSGVGFKDYPREDPLSTLDSFTAVNAAPISIK